MTALFIFAGLRRIAFCAVLAVLVIGFAARVSRATDTPHRPSRTANSRHSVRWLIGSRKAPGPHRRKAHTRRSHQGRSAHAKDDSPPCGEGEGWPPARRAPQRQCDDDSADQDQPRRQPQAPRHNRLAGAEQRMPVHRGAVRADERVEPAALSNRRDRFGLGGDGRDLAAQAASEYQQGIGPDIGTNGTTTFYEVGPQPADGQRSTQQPDLLVASRSAVGVRRRPDPRQRPAGRWRGRRDDDLAAIDRQALGVLPDAKTSRRLACSLGRRNPKRFAKPRLLQHQLVARRALGVGRNRHQPPHRRRRDHPAGHPTRTHRPRARARAALPPLRRLGLARATQRRNRHRPQRDPRRRTAPPPPQPQPRRAAPTPTHPDDRPSRPENTE